jgi:8-oxo-dGTP diphosphatase
MEARGDAVHELMRDIRAVDWLPLGDAVDRLSRGYERAFLENVGPIALAAARKARAKPPAPAKRRMPRTAESVPPAAAPTLAPPQPAPPVVQDDEVSVAIDATDDSSILEAEPVVSPSFAPEIEPAAVDAVAMPRKNLLQRMRDWLRRAA